MDLLNYMHDGSKIKISASGADIDAGDPVLAGADTGMESIPCVAIQNIKDGKDGQALRVGVFNLAVYAHNGSVNHGVQVFDQVFYQADGSIDVDTSGTYFGVALAVVTAGETTYIPVLLSRHLWDGTLNNAALDADIKVGSLATLNTAAKDNVTNAINEVAAGLGTGTPSIKTANYAVLATDSGKVFSNKGDGDAINYTLPTAAAGLMFSFHKTADYDLLITAASGDVINGGTAGKVYKNVTSEIATCTILAIDNTDWVVIAEKGTWANDNS